MSQQSQVWRDHVRRWVKRQALGRTRSTDADVNSLFPPKLYDNLIQIRGNIESGAGSWKKNSKFSYSERAM